MERICLILLLLFSLFFVRFVAQNNPDKITSLPGQPQNVPFDQYAGYITVNEKNQRKLFYFLVEAPENAASKPLVLWQTGGPGWSSLYAMLLENGPFTPSPEGKALDNNTWSWNLLANMIYVESPAGVGFSSSKVKSDYNVGDERTATDLIQFLTGFLAKYPKYKKRTFYLAGESYAGHYIPNLALDITKIKLDIDFKGFLVGNPWTYPKFDNNGTTLFWFTHGLMSIEDYSAINEHCNFNQSGPFLMYPNTYNMNKLCLAAITKVRKVLDIINVYDIYDDICMRDKFIGQGGWFSPARKSPLKNYNLEDNPCGPTDLTAYLNRADVQKAIHAEPQEWSMRSKAVTYSVQDMMTPMKKVWKQLLPYHNELKFLVYSGDVDAAVPWLGTLLWIKDLEKDGTINLVEDWNPWYGSTVQVGGFTLQYDKMTFKTVRDAGHQVPSSQPRRAYDMLNNFLNNKMD
ncbi:hypothetical protein LOD99_14965 [Oopsacas minuta]|uniref:Carboxypeptidase n=1 Tax=Oopsacas minuta TaxID=111878 RepID=A0AAV7KDW1_9METZ|nr:hypothetical protein LOD99_14965 [Oopsacas minuta]